jgi:hypothetical protein
MLAQGDITPPNTTAPFPRRLARSRGRISTAPQPGLLRGMGAPTLEEASRNTVRKGGLRSTTLDPKLQDAA